jgi:predicted RNA binding protein YcfA (HicA-like mRNA interferase family)
LLVGEAIKLLEKNGFVFVNQRGSHMKFKKDKHTFVIVKHRSNKEELHPKTEKRLLQLLK